MMNASTIESEQVAQGCLYFALVTQGGSEPRTWLKYGFTAKPNPDERIAAHRHEWPNRDAKLIACIQCRPEDAWNLEKAIKRIVKRSGAYMRAHGSHRTEWVPVPMAAPEEAAAEIAQALLAQAVAEAEDEAAVVVDRATRFAEIAARFEVIR